MEKQQVNKRPYYALVLSIFLIVLLRTILRFRYKLNINSFENWYNVINDNFFYYLILIMALLYLIPKRFREMIFWTFTFVNMILAVMYAYIMFSI